MAWQQAAKLLEDQEYGQVAQLLQEQQEAAQQSGQMSLVILLAAACQLCLTCRQFKVDRELHQIGLDKARRRERESRRQIQAILTVLAQLAQLEAQTHPETFSVQPLTRPAAKASAAPELPKQASFLDKVKHLLGFEPAPPEPAAELSASLDQPQAGSPAPLDQATLTEQLEQFIASTIGEEALIDSSDESVTTQATEEEAFSELGDDSAGEQVSIASKEPELSEGSVELPLAEEEVISDIGNTLAEPGVAQMGEELESSSGPTDLLAAEGETSRLSDDSSDLQAAEEKARSELNDESTDTQVAEQQKQSQSSDSSKSIHRQKPAGAVPSSTIDQRQPPSALAVRESDAPSLVVYCLGPFQTYLDERAIEKWPSGKGKSIFKYLVNNRQRPVPKEVLMDLFWPDADPDAARNNLNVAIYGLRQAFRNDETDISHVLYQNESYLLNPKLEIWLDVEEFLVHFHNARSLERDGFIDEAMQEYHVVEALYQGEFLEEDRYEEWPLPLRRRLTGNYLELLGRLSQYYFDNEEYTSCITICRSMLTIDSCLEDTHCRLMRCLYRQGQHHLALRQYHRCVKALEKELEVDPAPATEELYQKIRHHEAV